MQTDRKDYFISAEADLPFAEAVNLTRELLQKAGYGVLCEIDVKAKLEEKLGVERAPYVILGACNPPLAGEGLDTEPNLGVLLPCNVVVYEHDDRTLVAAVEPERILSRADSLYSRQRGAWTDRLQGSRRSGSRGRRDRQELRFPRNSGLEVRRV